MTTDTVLQDARGAWVLAEINAMIPRPKVVELAAKLNVGKSLMSEVLNKKANVSFNLFRTFCEQYGYDINAVNHSLIDKIKNELQSIENQKIITKIALPAGSGEGTTDMERDFMRETIAWQREFMQQMMAKIPDAGKAFKDEIPESIKKARGA